MPSPFLAYARMAAIGAASGLLSFFSIFIVDGGPAMMLGPALMPGIIFGLLIYSQFCRTAGDWAGRLPIAIMGSAVAYLAAYMIQAIGFGPGGQGVAAMAVGGLVGATVMGVTFLSLLGPLRLQTLGLIAFLGTFAGGIFGILVTEMGNGNSEWSLKFALGFTIWQSATAAPLGPLRNSIRSSQDNGPHGTKSRSRTA